MEILTDNLQDTRSIYNGDTHIEPPGYTGQYTAMEILIQNLQDSATEILIRNLQDTAMEILTENLQGPKPL